MRRNPGARYRTLRELLDRPEDDAEVVAARAELAAHSIVQEFLTRAATWPGQAIGRHNDASHPIYALSTLTDFGLRANDPDLDRSADGALQSVLNVAPAFDGAGKDTWSWVLYDAPTQL